MISRIIVSVAAVLALSAGVAYAAAELTSSDGTQVCVNNSNGLMRLTSECREGEHGATIGGTGGAVTQEGTFTVPLDATGAGTQLPMTGVMLSGRCTLTTPPPGFGDPYAFALFRIEADSGETMDAFSASVTPGANAMEGDLVTARVTQPVGPPPTPLSSSFGWFSWILTSNEATATVTVGAWADWDAGACKFLWQAVEVPN